MGSLYVDYAQRRGRTWLQIAKDDGVQGVVRYYDGRRVFGKGLSPEECADLDAAGLPRHAVFETSGGADIEGFAQGGDYFTHAQGRQDWREAVADARRCGQPIGTPIYLAVDRSMNQNDPRLRDYFQGATDEDAGSGYSIGCYARSEVCEFIRDTFGIKHLWPWTPRPPAIPDFDYDLWQYANAQVVGGASVDFNDCQLEGWTTQAEDDVAAIDQLRQELDDYKADVRLTIEGTDGGATPQNGGIKGILNWCLWWIRGNQNTDVNQQREIDAMSATLLRVRDAIE